MRLGNAAIFDDVLHLLEGGRVDDRDPAVARLGGVDPIEDQVVVGRVADVDAGPPVGDLELAVAGAHDLPGQGDAAALRHDIVDDDGLLGRVEEGLHRHPVGAEPDTWQRISVVVGQQRGAARAEVRIHVQRDRLDAGLDQAVDVEEPRRDGDLPHGQDP